MNGGKMAHPRVLAVDHRAVGASTPAREADEVESGGPEAAVAPAEMGYGRHTQNVPSIDEKR